jgi:hypothetical protein
VYGDRERAASAEQSPGGAEGRAGLQQHGGGGAVQWARSWITSRETSLD